MVKYLSRLLLMVSIVMVSVSVSVAQAVEETQKTTAGPVARVRGIADQLQAIQLGRGFNFMHFLILGVISFAIWVVYGDRMMEWVKSRGGWAAIFAMKPPQPTVGVEAVYKTLVDNGWTPDEAEEAVSENWGKIRKSLSDTPAAPITTAKKK